MLSRLSSISLKLPPPEDVFKGYYRQMGVGGGGGISNRLTGTVTAEQKRGRVRAGQTQISKRQASRARDRHQEQETGTQSKRQASRARDWHQEQETGTKSKRQASRARDRHQEQETGIKSKRQASRARDRHQELETGIRSKRQAPRKRDRHQEQESGIKSKRLASGVRDSHKGAFYDESSQTEIRIWIH
jgi:hypothetical protein